MRIHTAIVLLTLQAQVFAQTAGPVVSPDWAAESAAPVAERDRVIKEAVRELIAEQGLAKPLDRADAFRVDRYDRFERNFEEARIPGCLRPDGLKHQPARIGPIGLGYLLAVPFVVAAKLRGKCH